MTKLEELEKAFEVALEASYKEEKANKAKVEDFIQKLTDQRVHVRASVPHPKDIYVDVDFVGPDGRDDFASDFALSYRGVYDFDKHAYDEPEIAMDCGSSGLTTRREKPFKVERCHLMSAIWNHEQELVDLFKSLQFTCAEIANKARSAYESEKRRIEQQAEDELRAKVLDTVAVGKTFTEDVYSRTWNYKEHTYEDILNYTRTASITKITPKRVYLEWTWTTDNETANYKYEWTKSDRWPGQERKCIGYDRGYVEHKRTGYMPINKFTSLREQQFRGITTLVCDECDGQESVEHKFTAVEFVPAEE